MITKTLFSIGRCRPPNHILYLGLLALIVVCSWDVSNGQTSEKDVEDPFNITVEATPYILKFFINDTENYEIVDVNCKNVKNIDLFANENNSCVDLEPCSMYSATLSIKNLNVENEEVLTRVFNEATTAYVKPVVEIISVESGTEHINLTWSATVRSCVLYFQIEVKSSEKEFKEKSERETNNLVIHERNPCQEHEIQLSTYDVKNDLISNLTETTITKRIDPGNITDIIIDTTYEAAHAKVIWNPPQHKTCIDYYYLKWFTLDCENESRAQSNSNKTDETENPDNGGCSSSVKIADSNLKEYTINGLQGCENYGFQIFINSEINPKSNTEHFTALEEVPGAVTPLQSEIRATSVILHWTISKTNVKCVKYYEVTVLGPSQKEQTESDNVTDNIYAKFENLEPCGAYSYTVQPVSLNGTKGEIMSSTFETLEAKPSGVRHLQILPESNTLNVSWSEPDFADLCIKEYRLSLWTNGKGLPQSYDLKTTKTNALIDQLTSCQSYTLQIIPTTLTAEDGELRQMETETTAEKPDAPENLQTTSLYSDGIELSAVYYNSKSNCATIFAKFYCSPNKDDEVSLKKSAERTVEGKVKGASFKALLSPLSPFTEYLCTAKLYNIAGYGSTARILVTTRQYFAETPQDISLISRSKTSLQFKWKQPEYPNGNINVYISHFQFVRAEYFVPPKCPKIKMEPIKRESSSRQQSFVNLQPYTRYSIQVAAKNDYGVGEYTRPFMMITDPGASEPIPKLEITPQGPYDSDEEYHANVLISWTIPCRSNGQISSFELQFKGSRGDEKHQFNRTVLPKFDDDGVVVYNETNLKPDYYYKVRIAIRTGVDHLSAEQHGDFNAPAGIPKRFNDSTVKKARVDSFEASNPTNSAVVRFPSYILKSESGTIIYAALLISQKHCNDAPPLRFGALDTGISWPHSRKWSEAYGDEEKTQCIPQYQTTKPRWRPVPHPGSDEIQFTIGTENCNDKDKFHCNGPLKPDTEFYLVIRLFTRSGYNDAVVLEFHTESLIQLELILIVISCCLLFALFAGLAYIYIKKRKQWKRQSCHEIEDPFGDILAKNFATYYNEISRPERIAREFKELTMVAMDFSYAASELGCSKNRYTDIYPYDKNRVILDIDAEGSDYINASFIDGYRKKKQYIATQGPKPESTLDFWRMILQHNIRVIVMLTQFIEGEIVKCHEYFPYTSKGICVTIKKKEKFELYDRSEMSVTHDKYGLKQKVVHFYFKKWPDHGVPVDPSHLITFVRKVKAEKVQSYSSIVVHCSAGVGRTGTFIGLDIIMQRIKSESKINIYSTVKKLRFQRMKMVQTQEQYSFLYKCAYELVKHKDQRNKKKQNGKKVSFQIDTDASAISAISTLPNGCSSKGNSRLLPTELSSIEEIEHENSGADISYSNGNLNRGRPYLRLNYCSSPAIGNGFTKKTATCDEQKNDTNESAM